MLELNHFIIFLSWVNLLLKVVIIALIHLNQKYLDDKEKDKHKFLQLDKKKFA